MIKVIPLLSLKISSLTEFESVFEGEFLGECGAITLSGQSCEKCEDTFTT